MAQHERGQPCQPGRRTGRAAAEITLAARRRGATDPRCICKDRCLQTVQGDMPSANDNAVYNARILQMGASSSRFGRVACFLALMLMHVPMIWAGDWRAPEEQLARKIAAATGPGAVALDVSNKSSLSRTDAEEIRRGLTSELGALGVRLVNADQAAASVQVTLSENLQDYVWVAEIHQGNNEPSVVMVTAPRPGS